MNIILSTMGKSLDIGVTLIDLIKEKIEIDKLGFLVADSKYYKGFVKTNKILEQINVFLVKEWEYTNTTKDRTPDYNFIKEYEDKLGDLSFWNSLMADRRVFFGPYCKYKQDYPSRFSYDQLMIILQQALEQIHNLFEKVQPDVVLSFGTATLGDYIIYLFAKHRNITYRQLKATKVKNYVSFNDTPCDISSHILKLYNNNDKLQESVVAIAEEYLNEVRQKGLKYEGAILYNRSRLMKRLVDAPYNILKSIYGSIRNHMDQIVLNDCHVPGSFVSAYYYNLVQPLNAYLIEKKIAKHFKFYEKKDLETCGDFIFFPLHFEPEVSLQIFGRAYQNQIELIRNLALSVSVCTKVIVKEHPRSLGFRTFSYYKKLLDIPNVYLVNPYLKGHEIVKYSKMVAVITGTIGLEAAICEKPVITFGNAPYNVLPDSMVKHVVSLDELRADINKLLNNYDFDGNAILKYVSAFIQGSVPVDFYSVLLNKGGRYSENLESLSDEQRYDTGFKRLSDYFVQTFGTFEKEIKI